MSRRYGWRTLTSGRVRAQSWYGTGKPPRARVEPEPAPWYSGRHADGTAHRVTSCACGRDGEQEREASK